MTLTSPETAADFRAVIAYHNLRIYQLAPQVGLHPARLSLVLHERAPLHPELRDRLWRAIQEAAAR